VVSDRVRCAGGRTCNKKPLVPYARRVSASPRLVASFDALIDKYELPHTQNVHRALGPVQTGGTAVSGDGTLAQSHTAPLDADPTSLAYLPSTP
jgi:hypothetical protein